MASGTFLDEKKLFQAQLIAKRVRIGVGDLNEIVHQLRQLADSIYEENGRNAIDEMVRRILDGDEGEE